MTTTTQPRRILVMEDYAVGEEVQEGSREGKVMDVDRNYLHVLNTSDAGFTVSTYDLNKPTLPNHGIMDATCIAREGITEAKPQLLKYCEQFAQQHGGQAA